MENRDNKDKVMEIKDFTNEIYVVIIVLLVSISSFYFGRLSVVEGNASEVVVTKVYEENNDIMDNELLNINSKFVASVNGKKYYPLGCKNINRIKEENKIYFRSEGEAIGRGYERTSLCKN